MLANDHHLSVNYEEDDHDEGTQRPVDHLHDIPGVVISQKAHDNGCNAKDQEKNQKNADDSTVLGEVNLGEECKDADNQDSGSSESTSYHDGLLLVVRGDDAQHDPLRHGEDCQQEDVERPLAENFVYRTAGQDEDNGQGDKHQDEEDGQPGLVPVHQVPERGEHEDGHSGGHQQKLKANNPIDLPDE